MLNYAVERSTLAGLVPHGRQPQPLAAGSQQEFIAEHHWEHPPWRVAAASRAELDCDVAGVYGDRFASLLTPSPTSAFLADGSAVTVSRGVRLVGS